MIYRDYDSLSRVEKLACRWYCGDLFTATAAMFIAMATPVVLFMIDNAQDSSDAPPFGADRLSNWVYLSLLLLPLAALAERYKNSVRGRAMVFVNEYRSNETSSAVTAWQKLPKSEPLRRSIMNEIVRAHEDGDDQQLRKIKAKVNTLVSTYAERREAELAVRRVNGVTAEIDARVADLRLDISAFNEIAVQSTAGKDTVQP